MADSTSKVRDNIIAQLQDSISDDVGNMHEDNLEQISNQFSSILSDALKSFNSSTFDNDGFIKKLRDLDIADKDKDAIKNVLNNIRADYINVDAINQSELLMRRDIYNICVQMPEMRDVIYLIRDGIVECNVSTGEVSRSVTFENHEDDEANESQIKQIEKRHNLQMSAKNFIIPNTLKSGEMYVHIVPYAKLFAELEVMREKKNPTLNMNRDNQSVFRESVPNYIEESFSETKSLYSEENLKLIMESTSPMVKIDAGTDYKLESSKTSDQMMSNDSITKNEIKTLLENIQVSNGSSVMMEELGVDGFKEFVFHEFNESIKNAKADDGSNSIWQTPESTKEDRHFMEAMPSFSKVDNGGGMFNIIDQDDIDDRKYSNIKGCYIKYLDTLRMIPVRMDRRVIGYYYVTTTMDLQTNAAQPNGMIDLSYQHYTRDRNMVDQLANIIIKSFDKKFLDKNVKLKNEIAEIIMAHKFAEGKLSFIYIPENEVVRFVINEDENGKGHSVLEPTIFPARNYLMLNMYNMLYTLNNNTTRVHYLKSSGLNKDYAAQIQRTMRKFQSRRITIDDIYSYQGVLNKVGGMGEMVLPAGRNDYKALETDTIRAEENPISVDFLEQQRRQALSGTGAPSLLVINAIDEVDFAKTLEMANARFLSTVAAYKIDFNKGLTEMYQRIMKYETDMEDEVIQSFRYQFNPAKQQELNITSDMISNFNNLVEVVMSVYFSKAEMEDDKGNPSAKQMHLRKELAKEYLPQLDFDNLDEIVKRVNLAAIDNQLDDKVAELSIEDEDIDEISSKK